MVQVQVLHYNIFIISVKININKYINLFLLINADQRGDPETAYREILADDNINGESIEETYHKITDLIENKLPKSGLLNVF